MVLMMPVGRDAVPLDVPGWPLGADLIAEQHRLAALCPPPWSAGEEPLVVGAAFVAFERGEQGPGHPGDRAWVGAALVSERDGLVASVAVQGRAGAAYAPGLLAAREGPMLEAALRALPGWPDLLMVDATGRDHPRRAGLALHLGAVLDVPSVGVTHRPLLARGDPPPDEVGAASPLVLDGEEVGAWLCTARGVRPIAVHAAWRTSAEVAVDLVRRWCGRARTPEPLRQARVVARLARAGRLG